MGPSNRVVAVALFALFMGSACEAGDGGGLPPGDDSPAPTDREIDPPAGDRPDPTEHAVDTVDTAPDAPDDGDEVDRVDASDADSDRDRSESPDRESADGEEGASAPESDQDDSERPSDDVPDGDATDGEANETSADDTEREPAEDEQDEVESPADADRDAVDRDEGDPWPETEIFRGEWTIVPNSGGILDPIGRVVSRYSFRPGMTDAQVLAAAQWCDRITVLYGAAQGCRFVVELYDTEPLPLTYEPRVTLSRPLVDFRMRDRGNGQMEWLYVANEADGFQPVYVETTIVTPRGRIIPFTTTIYPYQVDRTEVMPPLPGPMAVAAGSKGYVSISLASFGRAGTGGFGEPTDPTPLSLSFEGVDWLARSPFLAYAGPPDTFFCPRADIGCRLVLLVQPPPYTTPGTYNAAVRLTRRAVDVRIPLSIEVLPAGGRSCADPVVLKPGVMTWLSEPAFVPAGDVHPACPMPGGTPKSISTFDVRSTLAAWFRFDGFDAEQRWTVRAADGTRDYSMGIEVLSIHDGCPATGGLCLAARPASSNPNVQFGERLLGMTAGAGRRPLIRIGAGVPGNEIGSDGVRDGVGIVVRPDDGPAGSRCDNAIQIDPGTSTPYDWRADDGAAPVCPPPGSVVLGNPSGAPPGRVRRRTFWMYLGSAARSEVRVISPYPDVLLGIQLPRFARWNSTEACGDDCVNIPWASGAAGKPIAALPLDGYTEPVGFMLFVDTAREHVPLEIRVSTPTGFVTAIIPNDPLENPGYMLGSTIPDGRWMMYRPWTWGADVYVPRAGFQEAYIDIEIDHPHPEQVRVYTVPSGTLLDAGPLDPRTFVPLASGEVGRPFGRRRFSVQLVDYPDIFPTYAWVYESSSSRYGRLPIVVVEDNDYDDAVGTIRLLRYVVNPSAAEGSLCRRDIDCPDTMRCNTARLACVRP